MTPANTSTSEGDSDRDSLCWIVFVCSTVYRKDAMASDQEETQMGFITRFEQQADQFAGLVEALLPEGYRSTLLAPGADSTASNRRLIVIWDNLDQVTLKVYLFDVPSGARGAEDLHFMYDLRSAEGVDVYPVAVPADILGALSAIHLRFE